MTLIHVDNLRKSFRVPVRHAGRLGALRGLLSGATTEVRAVDGVSFSVQRGEMVGYLGPNGAGKSTTLKMLTGILLPSGGQVTVDGRDPHRDRVAHARGIGAVFGQRTQLWWDLPTVESFELLRYIYALPEPQWRRNLDALSALLDLGPFLNTPVRQLSLGQRMRADLAAALLHEPPILFLDEPTIGLDVVAKERIRTFLAQVNAERGVTVMLTTHDLADIERLCKRVVLIDHGQVMFDGLLEELRTRYGRYRQLVVELLDPNETPPLPAGVELVRREGPRVWLRFDRERITAAALIAAVAERCGVRDLSVEEPAIEEIVRQIYASGAERVDR